MWLSRCLIRGNITVTAAPPTQLKLCTNCVPFTKCITKFDEAALDDAEDKDLDLIKYSSRKFRKFHDFATNDEATNFNSDIANDDNVKSFKYKAKY